MASVRLLRMWSSRHSEGYETLTRLVVETPLQWLLRNRGGLSQRLRLTVRQPLHLHSYSFLHRRLAARQLLSPLFPRLRLRPRRLLR